MTSTARPPRAPPLTSMPSTPGPEVPGGYPRDSVVFNTNKWDSSTQKAQSSLFSTAKTYLSAPKAYLPPAVASYFRASPSRSFSLSISLVSLVPIFSGLPSSAAHVDPASLDPSSASAPPGSPGHTPGVALHTDGSIASDFSTHAHAGRGSSRGASAAPTPIPSPVDPDQTAAFVPISTGNSTAGPAPPVDAKEERPVSTLTVVDSPANKPSKSQPADPGVVPLPSVAPFSSILTSTGRARPPTPPPKADPEPFLNGNSANPTSEATPPSSAASSPSTYSTQSQSATASTAPSSPASPATHTKFVPSAMPYGEDKDKDKGFNASMRRFTSLRGRRREGGAQAPPSAFTGAGHARGASLDSSSASLPTTAAPPSTSAAVSGSSPALGDQAQGQGPTMKRRHSLLRTLRGEATVLAGRVRGDKAKVDRGKRMVAGEV
ncbi:hypothetical protein C8R45DRAFT_1210765 [Mycena sanguinolenta]|nr:hypothetical protein C8R45DRAFT_1210765 [Mycena sanguinolenta]